MAGQGKYLYCIIGCSEERTFDGVAPVGSAPGPVFTIPYDGLAVVASNSPIQEYDTTRAHMLAHQRVLERVMGEFTLLPVRFGTVADPATALPDIQRLLQRRSPEFTGLLAEMEGKVELGLKALWKEEVAVFEEVLAETPAIRRLRDSLRNKSPELVRYQGIALGEMVKTALESKKGREAARLLERLRPLAYCTWQNETLGDSMVLNAAFLVETGREPDFDREISQLERELGHRLLLKYVGPVPPYNFVHIVVDWVAL